MSAQLSRILARMERHKHIFDFDQNGLGTQMVQTIADDILSAARMGGPPSGGSWPDLSPKYEEWKSEHYPGQPIGYLTGHMLAAPQVVGQPTITAQRIDHRYGVDAVAIEHATYFQTGGDYGKPRLFFRFGPIGLMRLGEMLTSHFRSMI